MKFSTFNNIFSLDHIDKILINDFLKFDEINILVIKKIENNKIFALNEFNKNLLEDEDNQDIVFSKENLEQEFLESESDEEEEEEDEDDVETYLESNESKESFSKSSDNNINSEKILWLDNFSNSKNELEEYKKLNQSNKLSELKFENSDCIICLNEFKSNDLVMKINKCQHFFHLKCITNWIIIKGKNFCPFCK